MSQSETLVSGFEPSTKVAIESELPDGKALQIVVLTRKEAESTTRVTLADGDHLVLTPQEVFSDGRRLTLRAVEQPDFHFSVWPALTSLQGSSLRVETAEEDGIFRSYRAMGIARKVIATWNPEQSKAPMPLPHSDAATVPTAAKFQAAPKWSIKLPKDAFVGLDDLFLNIDYEGDIARLNAADRLLTDDFYKGMPWRIGLKRFRPQVEANRLNVTVIPWRDRSKVVLEALPPRKFMTTERAS